MVTCSALGDTGRRYCSTGEKTTSYLASSGQEDRLARRAALYRGVYPVILLAFSSEICKAWMGDRLSVELCRVLS